MKKIALYRIFVIVFMAVKFFVQITLFQKRFHSKGSDQLQIQWEALLRRQAIEYRETALRLEGLLIKLGQFLSTRADIMPQVFIKELEDLVDHVPAVPWEEAKKVLENEWGRDYGEIIHKISIEPVASASIGEVYHGYLHSGEEVAVKIQRPGIEKVIRTDFKAIKIIMWLANRFTSYGKRIDLPKLYTEMRYVIGQELNFRKELENGRYFEKRYDDFDDVQIPSYYKEFSTRKVLVMEWMNGKKITDLSFLEKHRIDRQELAERLFKVFLEQLLQEGKFHADPHPGNILVKSDGTIVLIDFGMIGEVKKTDALAIREVVEGIIFDDYDKVINALEKLRFLLPHANKDELKRVLVTLISTYVEHDITQMDDLLVQQIFEDVQRVVKNEPIQMPSELAFFGRALSTFVGILYILHPKINLIKLSQPLIKDWLSRNQEGTSDSVVKLLREYARPLLGIPRQLQEALNEPKRYREWQERKDRTDRTISYYQSKQRDAFLFMVLTSITIYVSFLLNELELVYGSVAVFTISFLFYLRASLVYRRLVNQLSRKGE
ncbi:MAG: AarF/UbiB family protein [Bacillaceae bacterium]|nr:AarF/UbiB family protein [Bacillaceae bacterium]